MFTPMTSVLTALVCLLCFVAGMRRAPASSLTAPRLTWQWIAAGIFLLGAAFRLWEMIRYASAVLPEEAYTLVQARSLLESGKSLEGLRWPAAFAGWGGEPEGALLAWLTIPATALLGYSPFAVRLPMLLVQLLAMAALWAGLRQMFSDKVACIALLFVALSPWQLLQSRWALSWALFPHMMVIALYLLVCFKHRDIGFFLGMCALALAMYTMDAAWYIVPVFVLLVILVLWRQRVVRIVYLPLGLLLFVLLSSPALATLASVSGLLKAQNFLGIGIPQWEGYAHAADGLMQTQKVLFYGPPDLPAQQGYGLQFLPFLRDNTYFASLQSDLENAFFRLMRSTLFQYTDDPGYTMASFLPDYGYLYLFSIPLALLGLLLIFVKRPGLRKKSLNAKARWFVLLCYAWVGAALPFLLTHLGLATTHMAVLFYPLALLCAYGTWYLSQKIRFAPVVVVMCLFIGAGGFMHGGMDDSPTFPGLIEALQFTKEQGAEKIVVTTRLYPHADPAQASRQMASWAYQLESSYIRGEKEIEGVLPYGQRFAFVYMPSAEIRDEIGTYYILHASELYSTNAEFFQVEEFQQYAVMWTGREE